MEDLHIVSSGSSPFTGLFFVHAIMHHNYALMIYVFAKSVNAGLKLGINEILASFYMTKIINLATDSYHFADQFFCGKAPE